MPQAPVAALRKFVRPREAEERCDSCGDAIPPDHVHQFDPATRRIRCACQACAVLYRTIYREIPRLVRVLPDFRMTDAQWEDLAIPISLSLVLLLQHADGQDCCSVPRSSGSSRVFAPARGVERNYRSESPTQRDAARCGSAAREPCWRGTRILYRPD